MVPWDVFFFRLIFIVGYFKILKIVPVLYSGASQVPLVVKTLPASAEDIKDMCLIPELERSPGGGYGNPLQYSCLENPVDRAA